MLGSWDKFPSKGSGLDSREWIGDETEVGTRCTARNEDLGDLTPREKGLFALAPPHQGIDGEWSDRSGVIVYRWNEKDNRTNTGRANWKSRWSCCSEYGEDAPPGQRGWHVSYDDGFTLF
ncbi:hypothetical protein RJ639_025085 [Escallonia herrerae]|uniref:Uncharacterized protein n=1 Tax=Escallonia herrerae TaxID=1293975 RepID=A0AA88UXU9_9ASTE|nr:hypothetical protein RJ639_025085 [Escallonia herrerae]